MLGILITSLVFYVGCQGNTDSPPPSACESFPCWNGGTCRDLYDGFGGSYMCECPPSYVGTTCQTLCVALSAWPTVVCQSKSYTDAKDICDEQRLTLPRVGSYEAEKPLADLLKEANLTSTWTPIKVNVMDTLKWLDGSRYEYSEDCSSGLSTCCAIVERKMGVVKDIQYLCAEEKDGLVCEFADPSVCNNGARGDTFISNDRCFSIHFPNLDWFNSRNYCLRRGGDLAKVDSSVKRDMLTYINSQIEQGIFRSDFTVWLGAKNFKYLLDAREGSGGEVAYLRLQDSPDAKKECSLLEAKDSKITLLGHKCETEKKFLCVEEGRGLGMGIGRPTAGARGVGNKNGDNTTILIVMAVFIVLCIILFLALVMVCRKLNNAPSRSSHDATSGGIEMADGYGHPNDKVPEDQYSTPIKNKPISSIEDPEATYAEPYGEPRPRRTAPGKPATSASAPPVPPGKPPVSSDKPPVPQKPQGTGTVASSSETIPKKPLPADNKPPKPPRAPNQEEEEPFLPKSSPALPQRTLNKKPRLPPPGRPGVKDSASNNNTADGVNRKKGSDSDDRPDLHVNSIYDGD